MHKVLLLARIMLKSGGGFSTDKSGKTRWWLPVLLLVGFASFAFSIVMVTFGVFDMLAEAGAADILLPMAFGATSIVIFFFGIFYVVSTMYHANDIEILMGLPLRPHHILGAKFITLVVYEYIIESFILLPILAAYAIKSSASALFYVYSVSLFLILPIIALAMSAIIVMIVMRFTNFGKNKQAFKFVGGIIAITLAIGVNLAIQTPLRNISAEQIMAIAMGESTFVSLISNIFPGIIFASNALILSNTLSGLLNLALFILCSAGAVLIFLGVGQLFYLKGLVGVSEKSAKRKGVDDIGKRTANTPVAWAYIKKELRLLTRSPIAFLNCVLMNFIWPVLVIVMLITSGQPISQVSVIIKNMDSGMLIAIIAGASAFLGSANAITSTAISREGKALYFMKYIPIPMRKQLKAKTLTGMLLSGISVVFLIGISVYFGVDILTALIALILSLIAVAAASLGGLLIDVANPKLNWMNEQQAIKQNLNVVLHMLIGIALAAVAIVPVILLSMPGILAGVYTAVVFLLLVFVLLKRVNSYAVSKLCDMDA